MTRVLRMLHRISKRIFPNISISNYKLISKLKSTFKGSHAKTAHTEPLNVYLNTNKLLKLFISQPLRHDYHNISTRNTYPQSRSSSFGVRAQERERTSNNALSITPQRSSLGCYAMIPVLKSPYHRHHYP